MNALEVIGASRLMFVSGQIPQTPNGHVPVSIEDQCRLVWANLVLTLQEASMDVPHLVKVTTFLCDREHAAVNTAVRQDVLGDHRPSLTVIIAEIGIQRGSSRSRRSRRPDSVAFSQRDRLPGRTDRTVSKAPRAAYRRAMAQ